MGSKRKAAVISIINMKGGVGKTTIAISLADYLQQEGKKILLLDMDPQHNSTLTLVDTYKVNICNRMSKEMKEDYNRILKEKKIKDTFYSLYYEYFSSVKIRKTVIRLFESQPFEDKIVGKDIIVSVTENLDIICGDLALIYTKNGSNKRIKVWMKDNMIREDYDYIIIDCPPTSTMYTDAAIIASDFYVVPNQIERYSIRGIETLQKTIINLMKEEEFEIKCLGVVYTMYPTRNAKKIAEMKKDFESEINTYIFRSKFYSYSYYKSGGKGNFAGNYTRSKQDIMAFSTELLDIIERQGTI